MSEYGGGECAVPACGRSIPLGYLMCREHWYKVPRRLRQEVYFRLNQYESQGGTLAELRHVQEAAIKAALE